MQVRLNLLDPPVVGILLEEAYNLLDLCCDFLKLILSHIICMILIMNK